MSKILKALKKANLENERGSLSVDRDVPTSVDKRAMRAFQVDRRQRLMVFGISMVVCFMTVMTTKSLFALEKTKQEVIKLSKKITDQSLIINKLDKMVDQVHVIQPNIVVDLNNKLDQLEVTVADQQDELADTVITNELMKIAVEDLKMSEGIFVDHYITLNQDVSVLKNKMNMEGRNL